LSERLPQGSRFAVLASGSGTNLQALLDAFPENLVVVAGDKKEAFAFERARLAGIPVEHVDPGGWLVPDTCGSCRRSSSSASPPF
jgi:phosphoribosylglycinamide formyltransferase-1